MATRQLKLLSQQSNGTTFADPLSPETTVRFKHTASPKSINGASTTNYATEIIVNDANPVSVGGTAGVDAISIRVRVSGSLQSVARVKQVLTDLATQLPTFGNEGVLIGFAPTTPPAITPKA